ncbi:hypothetical protein LCGC14_0777570 [marine sediment metagenome]|uniref:Uncharacterized protein n=1 Tax=marine sediment metagenome TaxID=412755 RepID=A0A0F9QGD8_9ZZZZ
MNDGHYTVVKILNGDLVVLDYHGPGALKMRKTEAIWHAAMARKAHQCVMRGPHINKGIGCWRPITFGLNRYHRISAMAMGMMVAAHLHARALEFSSKASEERALDRITGG